MPRLVDGPDVYVGGELLGNGGLGVAKWNGTAWETVGEALNYTEATGFDATRQNTRPFTMSLVGSDIYIGGQFTSAGENTNVQYIAKLNRSSNVWESVGTPLNGPVYAIENIGNKLIIGGVFTSPSGNSNASHLAQLEGGMWKNLGTGIGGTNRFGFDGAVFALAVCETNLYVGGDFTSAGGNTNANGIASWNGKEWKTINHGLVGYTNDLDGMPEFIVYSISAKPDSLFVAGKFSGAWTAGTNQIPAFGVAKANWSEDQQSWSWTDLDLGVGFSIDDSGMPIGGGFGISTAIIEDSTPGVYDLFVGGTFSSVGSQQAFQMDIARWSVGRPPPPGAPTVTITEPTYYSTFTNASSITIGATVSSYTNISSVDFYTNGIWLASGMNVSNNVYTAELQSPVAGTYQITSVARDINNLIGESKPVLISVKSSTNLIHASDDLYNIAESSPGVILQVLTNDMPSNGLRISQVFQPRYNLGTVTLSHDRTYLVYTPFPHKYGTDRFPYNITNSAGSSDSAWVTVNVRAKPVVNIAQPGNEDRFGILSNILISGSALDYDGIVTNVALFADGMMIAQTNNPHFSFGWNTNAPGFYTFVSVATDNEGFTNASLPVTLVLTNTTPSPHGPIAVISNLVSSATSETALDSENSAVIREGLFQLEGKADDQDGDAVSYAVLLYRPQDYDLSITDDLNSLVDITTPFANITPGARNYQGFHDGAVNANLGTLDFTSIPNGSYDLVLKVRGGTDETNAIVHIRLDSQLKIGQFSFSEQDLVIPAGGIPLTVVRTYNSLNPLQGDFGYSWSYALNSMDVQLDEDRTPVTVGGAQALVADDEEGDTGLPLETSIRTGGGREVTLTLPNGRRTTFAFVPRQGPYNAYAEWKAPADVRATLTPLGSDIIDYFPNLHWRDGGDGSDYTTHDVPGWVLETQDGTKYYITRGPVNNVSYQDKPGHYLNVQAYGEPKLTRIVQRTGDSITINDSGIFHYNAANAPTHAVLFERDSQGRITAIHDPISGSNGLASVKYIYHQETGNLLQVLKLTDRNAGTYTTNKYHYDNPNFPHYITSVEDARGIPVAHNEYDDSGRLTAVVDTDGNRTEFLHDTTNHVEVVTDRMGNKTSHAYDTQGNVIATTNALQQVTLMNYDALNNKTREIVVGVSTNSFGYDANGFLTATTNALLYTSGFTYDSYGHQLTSTDARGFVTSNYYDNATGNLLSTSDAYSTNTYTYNVVNQLEASIDALGNSTTNGYDLSGNLTNVTMLSSNGTVMSSTGYAYDDNGNRKSQNVLRTTSSGVVHDITSFVYDGQNRLVQSIDPDGKTNTTIYNESGKLQSSSDRLARITQYIYDDKGNLVRTIFPDLTCEASAYDEAGRRIYSTNRADQVTRYVYDELGRVTQTIAPDNTTNRTFYDAGGRVWYTIDANGVTNAFLYDSQGRELAVTNGYNALEKAVLFYTYDANGNRLTMGDALQHTNFYFYDALNRMTNVTYPDGTQQITVFDTLGRRIAVTDQVTNTTYFGYDSLGRLTSVTDALNQVTRYEYDEAGNQTNQVDALNRKTLFEYDGLGRRTKRILPGLQTETFGYDAEGNLLYHTNFNGTVITNAYGSLNQLLVTVYPDRSSNSFTYTDSGQRETMTDVSGSYTYVYDSRDRLRTNATPQGTLTYDYDNNGNLTSIRSLTLNGTDIAYQYDALNRLTNVLDSRISLTTTNPTYCYDKVGNLKTLVYPNGVTNLYQYDSLNRLKQVTWKLNTSTLADFTYQLGLTGNRKSLQEVVNGVSRTNGWSYDSLYRLTEEVVGTSSGVIGSLTYSYDAVGNQTNRNGTLGILGSTSYTYSTNDWLNTDTYDDNGNTIISGSITYQYDYENRLANYNNGQVVNVYNADGQRVKKLVVSGGVTNTTLFLVSELNLTGYPQVFEELSVAGGTTNLDRAYVYGLALISQRQAGEVISFFGYDGHGSTRFLVNTNGTVSDTYFYGAYGSLISSTGSTPNRYLYNGEQYDSDLGFYYLRARYLNQNTGRFLTMDAYEGEPEDPTSLHKYRFASCDPVNRIDPNGHDDLGVFLTIADAWGWLTTWKQPNTGNGVGTGGPDVTATLDATLKEVDDTWKSWNWIQKWHNSESIRDWMRGARRNGTGADASWDIIPLKALGFAAAKGNFDTQIGGLTPGTASFFGSVSFNGQCYWGGSVNYALWGRINRLCHDWLVNDSVGTVRSFASKYTLDYALFAMRAWKHATYGDYGLSEKQAEAFTKYGYDGSLPAAGLALQCKPSGKTVTEPVFNWMWPPNKPLYSGSKK